MLATQFLALMLAAALNPLVVRAPEPHGNVPADCEVSDRPATPRVQIAAAEPDAAVPLPPVRPAAARKKADFDELNRALRNNDRAAFDAALARAKEEGQPTRVYEDVARLWDAQFEAPFFAQDSDAYRIASGYPGYEEAMRRHVFTDARGRKFYPAAESRTFVAGLKPATRTPAPTTRRASSTPSRPTPKLASGSPRRTTNRPRVATKRTESRKAAAPPDPAPPSRSPDPSAPPQSAAAEPAPAVTTADEPSSTATPPVAGSSDTAAPATTTTSAAPATTTTTKSRPILLPAILILIGLGVLILLFRTKA